MSGLEGDKINQARAQISRTKDFFVSYTGADLQHAVWIVEQLEANGYTQEKVEERLFLYRGLMKKVATDYRTNGGLVGVLLGCSLAFLMVGIQEVFAERPPVALIEILLDFLLPFLRYFVVVMALIGFFSALSMIFEVVSSRPHSD